jgi:hypothetical protein
MSDERIKHLMRFYSILDTLEQKIGGARRLADCSGRIAWPSKGVYFFREPGELRSDSGNGPRIVRVGTHALRTGSSARLWTRLSQHKGQEKSGGGNHRGSLFRLIVGSALITKKGQRHVHVNWGDKKSASREIRTSEQPLEREVSRILGDMSFLWLAVEDESGPQSLRGFIERNAISLLSNYHKPPLDAPSDGWLGRHSDRERVKCSGLWNSNHVTEKYEATFLDILHRLVSEVEGAH